MTSSTLGKICVCRIIPAATPIIALLLLSPARNARADWPENNTNIAKWYQFPDRSTNGYDILAGPQLPGPISAPPLILADDFLCTRTGPITDIHLWGSWLGLNGSTNVPPIPIELGIWTDVPAMTNGGVVIPSHPGVQLWSRVFGPSQYVVRPVTSVPQGESFWNPDPSPAGLILGRDYIIWQYNFYPTNPFFQQQGTIYWLSMTANPGVTTGNPPLFGWKTTATNQWGDDAVFGHLTNGVPAGDWKELVDPRTFAAPRSLDFSFVLTTPEIITNPPPPPPPPIKWLQGPQLFGGYDVLASAEASVPTIVADDFLCTNVSTITNIQIWASFFNDIQNTNVTFVLGIWSDVLGSPLGGFSHPGTLLWTETFNYPRYTSTLYAHGQEQFFDPNTGQVTPETSVFLYSFTPEHPFCQQGSPRSPMVYWLSVYSSNNVGVTSPFGWKTSTNHFRDDAVFGRLFAGGGAGNWQELFAPISTARISLDMAFLLNNGPPSPDCDRGIRPKWLQPPDTSTNGLDVLATAPEIVGDDFLCRATGPISGITFWGSWLNDVVDTNATFVLRLWTDVPAQPGTTNFSHPGSMLCQTTFYPPQAVGTSLQRYHPSLAAANLNEKFFNPDLGSAGFIGGDTQIWRYDFYPFQPGCWFQRGSSLGPGILYWVTIDYPPTNIPNPYMFGAKTAVTHMFDDAVFGHLDPTNNPLGDWHELIDPRVNRSLDLSHALWNFPVHGINKDLHNNTTSPATGIQVVVAGVHIITWHYDGTPPWPNFGVSYAGGNTVLTWSGQTIPSGGLTHVGFEMASSSNPQILSMNWLSGNVVLQPPVQQGNFHWLNNGTMAVLVNDIALVPLIFTGASVEWYAAPVPLDQMTPTGTRTPLASAVLQFPNGPCMPGAAALLTAPLGPTNATYALFILDLTQAVGTPGTTDFVLVALDQASPPLIDSVAAIVDPMMGNSLGLSWSAIPGRIYNIQYKANLNAPAWMDSGLGDMTALDSEMNAMVPVATQQGFYRIALVPQ